MVLLIHFPAPSEGIHLQQANTGVDIDGKDIGKGTLFISESCVAWQNTEDGKGFTLQYPAICCHAVSRDVNSFPHECLYLMVDGKLPGDSSEGASDEDDDEDCGGDESDAGITEVRFIPADKTKLDEMYTAMSNCQALHPDPEDIDSEDEAFADCEEDEEEGCEEENTYEGAEGTNHTGTAVHAQLANFNSVLQFGQGDGAGPSTNSIANTQHLVTPSGDMEQYDGEPMETGQFQDAEDME